MIIGQMIVHTHIETAAATNATTTTTTTTTELILIYKKNLNNFSCQETVLEGNIIFENVQKSTNLI
jgi:hypothetical protein